MAVMAVIVVLTALPLVTVLAGRATATDGDCALTGSVATFTAGGGASGRWLDPSMWDTNAVPTGGQICVPAGRTTVVESMSGFTLGSLLRVQGTVRITATGGIGGGGSIQNAGRIEVGASSVGHPVHPGPDVDERRGGHVPRRGQRFARLRRHLP